MWATTGRWRAASTPSAKPRSASADGRSLRVAGTIGMGDGERVRKLLASAEASQLKRVEL